MRRHCVECCRDATAVVPEAGVVWDGIGAPELRNTMKNGRATGGLAILRSGVNWMLKSRERGS